ncbi:MAG: (2Fe-2S) ferredoxin domain-containing protein [Cyanobacteria bacterium SZAS TMP-1]|nr:(2Fe-2S) ferredoxin domain-containing protein [Cyanobacteria bacterium SZAS TMP-1]
MSKKIKIYVCTEGKKCPKRGGKDVARALHKAAEGTGDQLVVKECKCLDLCKKGPAVIVMPDKVRYGRVTEADAAEIVSTHLAGGEPIKRLQTRK